MSSLICTFVQTSGDVALAAHSTSPLSVFVSIDRSGPPSVSITFCLCLSEFLITAGAADNHDERLAGEMRMPLPWMHDAVQLQAERPSKFDHLKSWTMKNYADKQSGKVKRSRMWAPPLRSVHFYQFQNID